MVIRAKIFHIVLLFFVFGCSYNPMSLEHSIDIPHKYNSGRGWIGGISPASKYIESYEKGWWLCVKRHHKNINHNPESADLMFSGYGESIDGFHTGYKDCDRRIETIIREKGENAAQDIIQAAMKAN